MSTSWSARSGLALAGVFLMSCGGSGWRQAAITEAEGKVRAEVGDPTARFSRVQLTGDSRTGQTCGVVSAAMDGSANARSGRFIVYIDNTAGPFIESNMGRLFIGSDEFARDWQADCINEGYDQ